MVLLMFLEFIVMMLLLFGFKCRSGKNLFIGKPEGKTFLFDVIGKQFQGFEIEIYDNKITYNFVNNDKPIYEEEMLKDVNDEKVLFQYLL